MWQKISDDDRPLMLQRAIAFTGDAELYGLWMIKVLDEWPISCEQNLSDRSMNRRAWIGHAASYLAIQSPEDVTREAWWQLSDAQRDAANAKADLAIKAWEEKYAQAAA